MHCYRHRYLCTAGQSNWIIHPFSGQKHGRVTCRGPDYLSMPTKSRTAALVSFSDGSCSETSHRDQSRGCGNFPGSRVGAHTFWWHRHVPTVAQTWQMQTGKLTVLKRQNFLHTFLLWHPCRRCLHLQPKQLLKEPDWACTGKYHSHSLGDTKATYSTHIIVATPFGVT